MLRAIRNTMANYAGGLATLAATLVFNALYFRMVDEETFGLISLLLTVSLVLPALDLGIGRTAGRVIAVGLAQQDDPAGLRDAVATLQATNAAVGIAFGTGVAFAAPVVASGWLQPQSLGAGEVSVAVALIGANIPFIMPRNFLIACLNGMKRQVVSNALVTSFAFLRGGAGLAALSSADDPLEAFLISQLLVHVLEVSVVRVFGTVGVPR